MSAPKVPKRAAPGGAAILDEVHAALGRYVVFPSPAAHDATTLYIAATHAQPAWAHATRLAILSPEKRCGKSRLLDLIENLSHEPLITVNISIAALVRSIPPADPPTVLVDEADAIFGTKRQAENHEELRGILNSGHQRNRPYIRWDITKRAPEECPTFAMAVLAAIGTLPDTIMDRAIKIWMRRRAHDEKVAPYRLARDGVPLRQLGDKLHDWVSAHINELREAMPAMPVEDRDADNWESLFAIAELAGGDWPERAAQACLALNRADESDSRIGNDLLNDLRRIWRPNEQALYTTTIVDRLAGLDESAWVDYGSAHRLINAREIAKLLEPYKVKSHTVRQIGAQRETAKGYSRDDLADPWMRYCGSTDVTDDTDDTRGSDELF